MIWRVSSKKQVSLDRPCIMAILNVTPDSFSDGGKLVTPKDVADAAERAVKAGARVLDVGGESTRPGADAVSADQQMQRVVPGIMAIRSRLPEVPITVDTRSAAVAEAALAAGADAINDISAGLDDQAMLPLAAARGAGVVLMHRLTTPERDRYSDQYETEPAYRDVIGEVKGFLEERALAAQAAGVPRESVVLDPGLGFGKTVDQNVLLLRCTREIGLLGYPMLSGLSRKSFVGRVSLGRESSPEERLSGTLAMSVLHYRHGARIFRVHDVAEHAAALAAAFWVEPRH